MTEESEFLHLFILVFKMSQMKNRFILSFVICHPSCCLYF